MFDVLKPFLEDAEVKDGYFDLDCDQAYADRLATIYMNTVYSSR